MASAQSEELSAASKLASAPSRGTLDQFTPTHQSEVPDYLAPELAKLSANFSVCVIGASRGIGEEIAYSYARAGATSIVLAARSTTSLDAVAKKISEIRLDCAVHVVHCDVGVAESVGQLRNFIIWNVGRLDAVIYNSGYSGDCILDVTQTPVDSFRTASEVNLNGTFYAAHHLVPLLLKTEDGAKQFLVVSSMAAAIVKGPIANAQYCVTKAAQMRLTEHVHEEYSKQGLLTVCIHPGAVLTEMSMKSGGAVPEFVKGESAAVHLHNPQAIADRT